MGSVAVGFTLTGLVAVVFLLWTYHEMRRVDQIIERIGAREGGEEAE